MPVKVIDTTVLPAAWAAAHLRPGDGWLVTGGAGFIGSHLAVELLRHGQRVTVLDDLSTGSRANLDGIRASVPDAGDRFRFIEGDCADKTTVAEALEGVRYVLHQAALGSIPRSFADPLPTDRANTHGFLTVLHGALTRKVDAVVFASSSSVYGDSPRLPKVEDDIGAPLSPYAISKLSNELYARVLAGRFPASRVVGLRYFNVFGPRQSPNGAYAAVIPRWIGEMLTGKPTNVFGDGSQSRDFCYVANVVQANLRAAVTGGTPSQARIFNIAAGGRTSLLELHDWLRGMIGRERGVLEVPGPQFHERRPGDIPHSHADVSRAAAELDYRATHDVRAGLDETVRWYVQHPEALT